MPTSKVHTVCIANASVRTCAGVGVHSQETDLDCAHNTHHWLPWVEGKTFFLIFPFVL